MQLSIFKFFFFFFFSRAAQAARPRAAGTGPARRPRPASGRPRLGHRPATRGQSHPAPTPASGPGVAHLPRCPRPPCPGTAASSGLAGPAAATRCPRLGRGEGPGKESHRRAAVHARPTLPAANLSAPNGCSVPPPPTGARAAAPPRPSPCGGRRAPRLLPALPDPRRFRPRLALRPALRKRPPRA